MKKLLLGLLLILSNQKIFAISLDQFNGSFLLTNGSSERCIENLIIKADGNTLNTNSRIEPSNGIIIGDRKYPNNTGWSRFTAKLNSNSIVYRSSWGEHCAIDYAPKFCMNWGVTDATLTIQANGNLIETQKSTTKSNGESEIIQCAYQRL